MEVSLPVAKCLHPVRVERNGSVITVPCGKCAACRLGRADLLSMLCDIESSQSKLVYFGTLTFSDEFVPKMSCYKDSFSQYVYYDVESGEVLSTVSSTDHDVQFHFDSVTTKDFLPYLSKVEVQKFLKRLRINLYRSCYVKFRFFLCGEYSPLKFRPHYHFLLFFDTIEQEQISEHVLGEFPLSSWYDKENPRQETEHLSLLEFHLRKSWSFGRVDLQQVENSASSYVSSYVNSFGSLPQVLRTRPLCPFALHSRFLGQKFCQSERKKAYENAPRDFRKLVVRNGNEFAEYHSWRSRNLNFFPKCTGYALKSTQERLELYRIFLTACQAFKVNPLECSVLGLAITIRSYFEVPFLFRGCDSALSHEELLLRKYLYYGFTDSAGITSFADTVPIEYIDKFTDYIYRQLLASRHFLNFCCSGDYSLTRSKWILSKIEDFYSVWDYDMLSDWYKHQESYFEQFESDIDLGDKVSDIMVYFYDDSYSSKVRNADYIAYSDSVMNRYADRVKHKKFYETIRSRNDIKDL